MKDGLAIRLENISHEMPLHFCGFEWLLCYALSIRFGLFSMQKTKWMLLASHLSRRMSYCRNSFSLTLIASSFCQHVMVCINNRKKCSQKFQLHTSRTVNRHLLWGFYLLLFFHWKSYLHSLFCFAFCNLSALKSIYLMSWTNRSIWYTNSKRTVHGTRCSWSPSW